MTMLPSSSAKGLDAPMSLTEFEDWDSSSSLLFYLLNDWMLFASFRAIKFFS